MTKQNLKQPMVKKSLVLYKIGEILRVFTLPEGKDIVITNRAATIGCTERFAKGITIELRNKFSEKHPLTIESAELAGQMGNDYLAFIVSEKLNQQAVKAFDQVWTPVKF